MKIEDVLQDVSNILQKYNVIWGLGGSQLLKIYGIYSNPRDIDLWVNFSDMDVVKNIFSQYKISDRTISLPEEYYLKIEYGSIELDFVSCFMVKPNQNKFVYYISPNDVVYRSVYGKGKIPCTLLENWYIIYKILKRNEKAELIETFFKKNNINSKILINSLHSNIPKYVKKDIKDFLKIYYSGLQLSLMDYIENDCSSDE